jgi:acyl-coenzyme A synthetase/AMP-(fatty) acid ligase
MGGHAKVDQLSKAASSRAETDTIAEALDRHCRDRLSAVKAPKSYEFVSTLPRSDVGKVRRGALAAERSAPADGG